MLKKIIFVCLLSSILCSAWFNNAFAENNRINGPNIYIEYAKKLLESKQAIAAEIKVSEGIRYYPRAIELYIYRGGIRFDHLNNYDGAMLDYRMALKIDPRGYPKVYYRIGDIFFYKKMYMSAVKQYTNCLHLSPKSPKIYFKRAKAYAKLGDRVRARADLRKCVTYGPQYRNEVANFWAENHL